MQTLCCEFKWVQVAPCDVTCKCAALLTFLRQLWSATHVKAWLAGLCNLAGLQAAVPEI